MSGFPFFQSTSKGNPTIPLLCYNHIQVFPVHPEITISLINPTQGFQMPKQKFFPHPLFILQHVLDFFKQNLSQKEVEEEEGIS
jgi:hypothetical protein